MLSEYSDISDNEMDLNDQVCYFSYEDIFITFFLDY